MNSISHRSIGYVILFCLAIALLTGLLYYFITSHYSFSADFFIYWNASKALFREGISPYASEVTIRIQNGVYNRPARPSEDQLAFAYPPYSLLVVYPTASMPYAWAQSYWMAFNLILLLTAVRFALPRLPAWILFTIIFYYPVARTLVLGQYAFILGSTLFFAYGLIHKRSQPSQTQTFIAGTLLAWALMKPHITGVIIAFFFLDAVRRKMWWLFYGFGAGMLALLLLSWLWVPDWLTVWWAQITDYVGYVPITPLSSVYASFLGSPGWTRILSGMIIAALASFALWIIWNWWQAFEPDYIALGALILLSQIVSPNPYSMASDQIMFLIPVLIWLNNGDSFRVERVTYWGTFIIVPWIIFLITFNGRETLAVAATLPIIFCSWLFLRFFKTRRKLLIGAAE